MEKAEKRVVGAFVLFLVVAVRELPPSFAAAFTPLSLLASAGAVGAALYVGVALGRRL